LGWSQAGQEGAGFSLVNLACNNKSQICGLKSMNFLARIDSAKRQIKAAYLLVKSKTFGIALMRFPDF